ncbi:unnamed protein product [Prorocentrum cordatum]|uniref:Uncharacterized protein n=1 Tax=Prorocentrum cordatum TaxID=2364126 RepID=A0ABN9UBH8_9DINO|nr:unnamed protein product [Polarella glacialis]
MQEDRRRRDITTSADGVTEYRASPKTSRCARLRSAMPAGKRASRAAPVRRLGAQPTSSANMAEHALQAPMLTWPWASKYAFFVSGHLALGAAISIAEIENQLTP